MAQSWPKISATPFLSEKYSQYGGGRSETGPGREVPPYKKIQKLPDLWRLLDLFLFGCGIVPLYLLFDSCVDVCVHAQTVAGCCGLYDFFFTIGQAKDYFIVLNCLDN